MTEMSLKKALKIFTKVKREATILTEDTTEIMVMAPLPIKVAGVNSTNCYYSLYDNFIKIEIHVISQEVLVYTVNEDGNNMKITQYVKLQFPIKNNQKIFLVMDILNTTNEAYLKALHEYTERMRRQRAAKHAEEVRRNDPEALALLEAEKRKQEAELELFYQRICEETELAGKCGHECQAFGHQPGCSTRIVDFIIGED